MTCRKLLLCGASLWLAACGSGFSWVRLMTDRHEYRPGARLTLELLNQSAHGVGYNLCYTDLQRRGASGWERVSTIWGDEARCLDILHGIFPRGEDAIGAVLKADLPAGEYRFVTDVEWNGTRRELASNSFQVVPPASP